MSWMADQNRKKLIIASIMLVAVVIIVGISYAWLSITLTGQKTNVIKVGNLDLVLDETTSNGITIENGVAITDEEGLATDGSTFSLINNGDADICYELYLDDMDLESGETRVADKFIKFSLDKGTTTGTPKVLTSIGSNPNRLLDSGTISSGETINFNLRMWFNSEEDGNYSGQVFRGKLRVEATQCEIPTAADTILANLGENGAINTSDPDQTFITGTDPNNYIWYSGKLWRAVSIDPSDNSVKLVTQWNISTIPYNPSNQAAFEGSYMETWLNDTSVDGFLGNLRDYESFIKTDSVWNATMTEETTKPAETTMISDAVGLLNAYEYTKSYSGTDYSNGYLNNGLYWWLLTPYSTSNVRYVLNGGYASSDSPSNARGVRPSINLKSSVKIVSGDGTENNPYRLEGDNDSNVNGILLNTRYSGEYIKFGEGENTLYRIVSHETKGLTKITSTEALKSAGSFIRSAFGNTVNYSSSNTVGTFLNGDYLTSHVGSKYSSMIEPSTTWYLGTVGDGASYRLAKYSSATGSDLTTNTTTTQVGLLRLGELMSGQFERYAVKGGTSSTGLTTVYWTLTPYSTSSVRFVYNTGRASNYSPTNASGVRPSMNLKSSVMITGGSGTKSDPFVLSLGS